MPLPWLPLPGAHTAPCRSSRLLSSSSDSLLAFRQSPELREAPQVARSAVSRGPGLLHRDTAAVLGCLGAQCIYDSQRHSFLLLLLCHPHLGAHNPFKRGLKSFLGLSRVVTGGCGRQAPGGRAGAIGDEAGRGRASGVVRAPLRGPHPCSAHRPGGKQACGCPKL